MKSILFTLFFFLLSSSLYAQTAEEAQVLHDKGRECFNAGKVVEAREYTLKAMEMRKALFGEVNEDYTLEYYRMVVTFYEEKDSEAARKNIAMCHKGMGNIMI